MATASHYEDSEGRKAPSFSELETQEVFVCEGGCDATDQQPDGPLYECPNCSRSFTRGATEGYNHKCPDCGKFASRVEAMGCDDCTEYAVHESIGTYCENCTKWIEVPSEEDWMSHVSECYTAVYLPGEAPQQPEEPDATAAYIEARDRLQAAATKVERARTAFLASEESERADAKRALSAAKDEETRVYHETYSILAKPPATALAIARDAAKAAGDAYAAAPAGAERAIAAAVHATAVREYERIKSAVSSQ